MRRKLSLFCIFAGQIVDSLPLLLVAAVLGLDKYFNCCVLPALCK